MLKTNWTHQVDYQKLLYCLSNNKSIDSAVGQITAEQRYYLLKTLQVIIVDRESKLDDENNKRVAKYLEAHDVERIKDKLEAELKKTQIHTATIETINCLEKEHLAQCCYFYLNRTKPRPITYVIGKIAIFFYSFTFAFTIALMSILILYGFGIHSDPILYGIAALLFTFCAGRTWRTYKERGAITLSTFIHQISDKAKLTFNGKVPGFAAVPLAIILFPYTIYRGIIGLHNDKDLTKKQKWAKANIALAAIFVTGMALVESGTTFQFIKTIPKLIMHAHLEGLAGILFDGCGLFFLIIAVVLTINSFVAMWGIMMSAYLEGNPWSEAWKTIKKGWEGGIGQKLWTIISFVILFTLTVTGLLLANIGQVKEVRKFLPSAIAYLAGVFAFLGEAPFRAIVVTAFGAWINAKLRNLKENINFLPTLRQWKTNFSSQKGGKAKVIFVCMGIWHSLIRIYRVIENLVNAMSYSLFCFLNRKQMPIPALGMAAGGEMVSALAAAHGDEVFKQDISDMSTMELFEQVDQAINVGPASHDASTIDSGQYKEPITQGHEENKDGTTAVPTAQATRMPSRT